MNASAQTEIVSGPHGTHRIATLSICESEHANAKLIAAAPTLADALTEALRMLREVDTSLGQIEEADAPHLYAALRAAGRIP